METNKCNTCFYALMDRDLEAPCVTCTGYSNYVKGTVYMTNHASKPLKEAIDAWFKLPDDGDYSDFGGGSVAKNYPELFYNSVSKPKHYMLFEDEGIEVRDVIEKLVTRMCELSPGDDRVPLTPMFDADYVQMMQYLMRFMDKNGVEDLKKAKWYLDKLIDAYEPNV